MKSAGTKILTALVMSAVVFGASAVCAKVSAATLTLSPASGTYDVDDTVSVDVILNAGSDTVSAADIVLEYDTTKLSFVEVQQVSGLNYSTTTESGGTILIGVGSTSGLTGSSVKLATIVFEASVAGTATVDYVTTGALVTSVIDANSGELLTSSTGGSYTISSGSTTDDDDDYTGKGAEQPETGVFDSMNKGLLIGAIVLGSGIVFSFASKKFYRE